MTTPLSAAHTEIPVGSLDVLPRIAAARWPHRAAIRTGVRTLTFAELDKKISRLAFGLRTLIGGDGMVVAVSALPGIDFPVAYYAVIRSGNVVAPVNPRMPTAAFQRLLDTTRPAAVILGRAMYERVRPALATSHTLEQTVLLDAPSQPGVPTCEELATLGGLLVEPRDRDEREVAAITLDGYSAGRTHQELKARAAANAGGLEHAEVLNALPGYHPDHLNAGVLGGATQVLWANPDPEATSREAIRAGASHLCTLNDGVAQAVRIGHPETAVAS